MLRPEQRRHILQFWSSFLGCKEEHLQQPGVHVAPHGELAGYTGAWAFRVGDSCVVSVPKSLVPAVRESAAGLNCEQVYSRHGLTALAGATRVERIIGPCFVGYHSGENFRRTQNAGVCRLLTDSDVEQIAQLQHHCGGDWEIGGVEPDTHEVAFGCFDGDRLAAAASYELWGQNIAHLCVVAAPQFRGRGFARSAAAHATEHALSVGLLPQWRTECSNAPAVAIARNLGFEESASHYALRLRI